MKSETIVMKSGKLLLGTGFALLMVGCATPARVDQMQVAAPMATRTAMAISPMRETITIKDVTGGKDTNPMWVSSVSSSDFERALEASLKDAGLLSPNRQGSKYVLIANLAKLDQPMFGASMTVTASVRYSLLDRATNLEVFDRTLVTPYTAAWNDAFVGSERLKLANEGAVRMNIQQLIDALAAFKAVGVVGQIGK
jgi:hypothetical protein